jgi:hypothetical protein
VYSGWVDLVCRRDRIRCRDRLLELDVPGIHDGDRGGGALRDLCILSASHSVEVWNGLVFGG